MDWFGGFFITPLSLSPLHESYFNTCLLCVYVMKILKMYILSNFQTCSTILWTKVTRCTLTHFKTRSVLRHSPHRTPVYLFSSPAMFPFTPVLSGLQRADRCLTYFLCHLPHTSTWFFHWVYLCKDVNVKNFLSFLKDLHIQPTWWMPWKYNTHVFLLEKKSVSMSMVITLLWILMYASSRAVCSPAQDG